MSQLQKDRSLIEKTTGPNLESRLEANGRKIRIKEAEQLTYIFDPTKNIVEEEDVLSPISESYFHLGMFKHMTLCVLADALGYKDDLYQIKTEDNVTVTFQFAKKDQISNIILTLPDESEYKLDFVKIKDSKVAKDSKVLEDSKVAKHKTRKTKNKA